MEFVRGSKNITYYVRLEDITLFLDDGQHQADVRQTVWSVSREEI